MPGIVFIETVEDAHHFKELVYQKDARFTLVDIVSLNPNIHAYLKKNEIPCLTSAEILNDKYLSIFKKIDIWIYKIKHSSISLIKKEIIKLISIK